MNPAVYSDWLNRSAFFFFFFSGQDHISGSLLTQVLVMIFGMNNHPKPKNRTTGE
jgi:hypothetical protein